MREEIRNKERLNHIVKSIDRIMRYTDGNKYEDLLADDMMYYAVVKNIEMIGEAANMLTEEFITSHPDTPWKMIRGMRNYIVHEYFQIDSVVVWDVITNELAKLREQVVSYAKEL